MLITAFISETITECCENHWYMHSSNNYTFKEHTIKWELQAHNSNTENTVQKLSHCTGIMYIW